MRNTKILFITTIFISILLSSCSKEHSEKIKSKKRNNFVRVTNSTAQNIRLEIDTLKKQKVSFYLKYNGVVKENPKRYFTVDSLVSGRVVGVFVEPNQYVNKGEALAELVSHNVAELELDLTDDLLELEKEIEEASLDLALAKESYERELKLFNKGIVPKKDFLAAEKDFKLAENRLKVIGRQQESFKDISQQRLSLIGSNNILGKRSNDAGSVIIKSPGSGIVLQRLVNPGEAVEENELMFEIADLSEVFIETQIYEQDMPKIKSGQFIKFISEALPDKIYNGVINYVASVADPNTRTLAIKARVDNVDFSLHPETFGKVMIISSEEEALVVNKKAINKVGNTFVVYKQVKNGFEEFPVEIGRETDDFVEIISGVDEGSKLATEGSFWLKSELHHD